MKKYKIGIIGGSGLYTLSNFKTFASLRDDAFKNETVEKYIHGDIELYFLPRHGKNHTILPHEIDYVSNMRAFKELGVDCIVSFCTVGSLRKKIVPGSYVIPDGVIDFTHARAGSAFVLDDKHVNIEPLFNAALVSIFKKCIVDAHIPLVSKNATLGVIDGPRFATLAEQKMYQTLGCDALNMTQMPEIYLSHIFKIPWISLCHVTDTTAVVDKKFDIYSPAAIDVFMSNAGKIEKILSNFIVYIEKHEPSVVFESQKISFV